MLLQFFLQHHQHFLLQRLLKLLLKLLQPQRERHRLLQLQQELLQHLLQLHLQRHQMHLQQLLPIDQQLLQLLQHLLQDFLIQLQVIQSMIQWLQWRLLHLILQERLQQLLWFLGLISIWHQFRFIIQRVQWLPKLLIQFHLKHPLQHFQHLFQVLQRQLLKFLHLD